MIVANILSYSKHNYWDDFMHTCGLLEATIYLQHAATIFGIIIGVRLPDFNVFAFLKYGEAMHRKFSMLKHH